jgi:hypothetical protein
VGQERACLLSPLEKRVLHEALKYRGKCTKDNIGMKRNFLSRLQTNGIYYIIGALLLLLIIPAYQLLVLTHLGYGNALRMAGPGGHIATYLAWISAHTPYFIIHHLLLALAFAMLLSLPFALFRIIVAQELVDQQERAAAGQDQDEEDEADEAEEMEGAATPADDVPSDAWRGKGFAVVAAWAGLFGLIIYILGTIADMLYLAIVSRGFSVRTPLPGGFTAFSGFFAITTNTLGIGLLALSELFFGAVIARRGRNLWPGIWVVFAYTAIAVAALFSGSAVAIASAPTEGQAAFTSPAVLLFALWVLWLGIMLVRLKAEP